MIDIKAIDQFAAFNPKAARLLLIERPRELREFDRRCATRYAAELLAQKLPRAQICQKLCGAHQLSKATAYRIISDALNATDSVSPRPVP